MRNDWTPVTRWDRYKANKVNNDGQWIFNHIEDGWQRADRPLPRYPAQLGWKGALWRKTLTWLHPAPEQDKQDKQGDITCMILG